jgi:single-strand DNA-binding protein
MLNSVTLIGRLTADPELRYTPSGKEVSEFTVAVNRPGKDSGADFIRVVAWNGTAKTTCEFKRKGDEIAIEGSIRTDSYEKDGQRVYTTKVWASRVHFLRSKNGSPAEAAPSSEPPAQEDVRDDDIPF